jgi:hypothetical protein
MKAIVVLALFFSAVLAQPYIDLVNATTATVIQVATPGSDTAAQRVQTAYRIWVPENTLQVVVEAGSPLGGCSDPEVMIAARGITCHHAYGDYPYGFVPCADYYETTSNVTWTTANSLSYFEDVRYGSYWYIGIRKDTTGYDRDKDCTFALTVTVEVCPAGQVSVGSTPVCVTPVAANASTTYALHNVTSADNAVVYYVDLATSVQRIEVLIYSDDSSLEVAGWPQLATEWSYAQCYSSADSNGLNNMTCYGVRAGRFFIGLTTSSTNSGSGNITVNVFTCPTNFTGLTCSDKLIAFNSNIAGGIVPGYGSATYYTQDVYYIDFNVNDTVELNITVSSADSGVLIYRKDVAPYYDSPGSASGGSGYYGFDSSYSLSSSPTIYFTARDTYTGGRHYFSVVNTQSTTPLNYTFTVFVPTTTTGAATAATAGGLLLPPDSG